MMNKKQRIWFLNKVRTLPKKNITIDIPEEGYSKRVSEIEWFFIDKLINLLSYLHAFYGEDDTPPIKLEILVGLLKKDLLGESIKLMQNEIEKQYEDRGNPVYFEWRKKVLKRDCFKCQICGLVGGRLEIHHIRSWKNYPELRYEVSNGVTLCQKCHKTTDTYLTKIDKEEEENGVSSFMDRLYNSNSGEKLWRA